MNGFDSQETKLPTYWNTSFSKVCLGMRVGYQLKFIVINKRASSLYSLIADGQYRKISLGRDTWSTLIGSEASLQPHCNMEGFNALEKNGGLQGKNWYHCQPRKRLQQLWLQNWVWYRRVSWWLQHVWQRSKARSYILVQWQGKQWTALKPRPMCTFKV